jgi:endo-1,3(4)-beta-glucanase
MNRKKLSIIIGGIVTAIIVATITLTLLVVNKVIQNPLGAIPIVLVDQTTLDGLSKKSGSSADTKRIDKSIIPPTNSWISGLVLQKTPLPVYPMPLSFLAKDTGFEVGLPNVQSTATVISGEHIPGITATIDGATSFSLTRYDKVSATLTYTAQSKQLGTTTLAEGSPFVFYRASSDSSLQLAGIGTNINTSESSSYLRYTKAGHDYVIRTQDGAKIAMSGSTASIVAPRGSLVTFYGLTGSGDDRLQEFAGNELSSVATSSTTSTNNATQTTFEYKTTDAKPTIFVPMSYSHLVANDSRIVTYDSIYGPMGAVVGNTFTTSVETVKPSNQLDLSRLSDAHKQQLIASLSADISKTSITAMDSYYAGKQLARAATLLDIAEQLGQTESSSQLKLLLNNAFAKRLDSHYFYYDPTLRGVAAQTNAFGSEDFNDHHFHYGYFIYAASILGKYDSAFLNSSQKQGNNQESSSEAINAWNGVALWAKLTHNTQLISSASWMLSNEEATARAAWRTVDTSVPYLKNFTSPLTSLNFGGKRTYSTFFSDEANTKLGIQLIPMSPMMLQYVQDGSSINVVTSASIRNDNYNVALGDYVLMYMALSQPQKAAQLVSKQQDAFIDDGNSRTYLDAWVFLLTDTPK